MKMTHAELGIGLLCGGEGLSSLFLIDTAPRVGSLGAVIILLLWFYLSGAALLIGAEINTVIEDAAAADGAPDAKQKGEKEPAALTGSGV